MFTLFGLTLGLRTILVVGVLAAAGSGFAGWKVRDKFCQDSKHRSEIASLQRQIKARDEASKQDAERAKVDAEALAKLEDKTRELETKISRGQCFTDDDSNRVRDLWKR